MRLPLKTLRTLSLPGKMIVGFGWVREEGACMAASAFPSSSESEVQYESPIRDELGDVVELTMGTAADDTADMKTAKYW